LRLRGGTGWSILRIRDEDLGQILGADRPRSGAACHTPLTALLCSTPPIAHRRFQHSFRNG
jgi:hypothetical protein